VWATKCHSKTRAEWYWFACDISVMNIVTTHHSIVSKNRPELCPSNMMRLSRWDRNDINIYASGTKNILIVYSPKILQKLYVLRGERSLQEKKIYSG